MKMNFPTMDCPQSIRRWQWQSNSNPWSESEEPLYQDYSVRQSYLLEKADYDQQNEVDLGDYIISIKHMIQKKKGILKAQRRIRRIDLGNNFQEGDRSERYFKTEVPKTINKIFGSLHDFIDFFSRRKMETSDFHQQFKQLERSNDLDGLNHDIIPKLVDCLEGELIKKNLKQVAGQQISSFQKKILERNKQLILLFQREFSSFEEFYGQILRAYTMNADLYPNLNKYLRDESWTEIDNLLPYVFCLCKAFFSFRQKSILNEGETKLKNSQRKKSKFLYRGTALAKLALKSYDVGNTPFFSWYSVTSTSTSKQVAEDFMFKSADIHNKKFPAMFIIEIPFPDEIRELDYLEWIDIHQYSALPDENEVVLPPGSVFELQEVSTDKDEITTIKLKLLRKFQFKKYKELKMHKALQEMTTEKDMKIVCLEGEWLSEALKSLSENKSIEEVEFCLCTFDKKSLKIMMEILSTMKIIKTLKFISCSFQDDEEALNKTLLDQNKDFQIAKVEIFETNDFYKIFGIKNQEGKFSIPVRQLDLNFRNFRHLKDAQELENLTHLASLSLDLDWNTLKTSERMQSLTFNGLEKLTQLTSLTLSFSGNQQDADEGINSFTFPALKHLRKLKSFSLSFKGDKKIRGDVLNHLFFEGLGHLTQLSSLALAFCGQKLFTDSGVNNLAFMELHRLIQLEVLNLSFEGDHKITDYAIKSLVTYGLKQMTKLKSLILNFQGCKEITNGGFSFLASEGLKCMPELTCLKLNLSGNQLITDEGIMNFATQGLRQLQKLASLTLDFSESRFITREGINQLVLNELKHLDQLTFRKVSNRRVELAINSFATLMPQQSIGASPRMKLICRRFLKKQKQLQEDQRESQALLEEKLPIESLRLSSRFENLVTPYFERISNFQSSIGFSLTKEIFDHFRRIEFLSLKFFPWISATDKFLHNFVSQGLKMLTQLKSLNLDLRECSQITDLGVTSLASKGLNHLTQLVWLSVHFTGCDLITDEGVHSLAVHGLRNLVQLRCLTFHFSSKRITDNGLNSLAAHGLKYLVQLEFLTLGFLSASPFGFEHITDQGMKSLVSHGLENLTKLTHLTLELQGCMKLTDKGVISLTSQIIKHLLQLTSLIFNFEKCNNLTEFTISDIIRALHYFGFSICKLPSSDFCEIRSK